MKINSELKCIIVEDEVHSRNYLRGLLTDYCKDVEIIDEVGTVKDAISSIEINKPALLFLDIELAGENGFSILEAFGNEISFSVIFVTAYQEYAVKAFKYAAVSYLLKPIMLEELQEAIKRAKILISQTDQQKQIDFLFSVLKKQDSIPKRIALSTNDGFVITNIDDIVRIEADGSYTKFFMYSGESLVVCKNLAHFEEIFTNTALIRIHKSAIVNIKYVEKYVKNDGGYVVMKDNVRISISERKRKYFLEMLTKI